MENLDEIESVVDKTNPNLDLAQLKFVLTLPDHQANEEKKTQLLDAIESDDMAPYYELVCADLNWKLDEEILNIMREENQKALSTFDEEIEYALNNLSVIEVKEAYLNKANYLSKIGDKENAIKTLSQAYDKTVSLGYKLDNVFHCIQIGLFFMDIKLITRSLQRCEGLLELGADWHRRNCHKIFTGLYALLARDFPTVAENYIDAISTFTCTEVMTYETFVTYAVLAAMLVLPRSDFKKRVIDNADVLQALHFSKTLRDYVFSLYNSEYNKFFLRLADVEKIMSENMFLNRHYKFYIREMKIKAYDQLLSTYISVSLSYMANQFGVSSQYIENDISKLIAAGKLNYKIDKISDTVVNVPKNSKNDMFRGILKQGDLLLNRIHKLSRVINI